MKKIITFVFLCGCVLYLSNMGAYAQGRGGGQGHAPAVSGGPSVQSRASETSHGKEVEHGKNLDKGKDVDKIHATKEAKEAAKDTNVVARIDQNPAVKARVDGLLPAGMNLKTAAAGFRNEGQFISALH